MGTVGAGGTQGEGTERWGGADSVSYRCQNLVAVHDTCTGDLDNNKVAYSVFHYLNRH